MNKRKKKSKRQTEKYSSKNISKEELIKIQAEAYYRAFKRMEDEKDKSIQVDEKKLEKRKGKWYEDVLFMLNVFFFPWHISKKYIISNQIYDRVLVLVVSEGMKGIGTLMWLFGMYAVGSQIYQIFITGITGYNVSVGSFPLCLAFLGSTVILAGKEFEKETDSIKIYSYSASIIALISCLVGIFALFGI